MAIRDLPLANAVDTRAVAHATTPAVIVGATADALGIARGLGAAGVPVTMVDDDALAPAMHSRYVRPHVVEAISGPALVDGLLALRRRFDEAPVMFMTTDLQVRTISEQRERLQGAFRFRLPEHRCVTDLLHKASFQQLAERSGFRVPRAVAVRTEADLEKLADLRFPAVLKPGIKDHYFNHRAPRAQRLRSRQEAEGLCRAILPLTPDLIVQEWIVGEDSDIYFCLQYRGEGGATVASFTGRKLRCWPPHTGSTATCTAAPEVKSELDALTTAFFDAARFVGMGSMEFKRDRRNGEFYMVEPTVGRTDWQEEVATLNGTNIPLAAYGYELGLPPLPSQKPAQPRIWSYPPSYWRSVIASRSFRDQRPAGAHVHSACWRRDDPMPLAFFWLEWARRTCIPALWHELFRPLCRPGPLAAAECNGNDSISLGGDPIPRRSTAPLQPPGHKRPR